MKAFDELQKIKQSIIKQIEAESKKDPENLWKVLERVLDEQTESHGLDNSERAWLRLVVRDLKNIVGSEEKMDLLKWRDEAKKIKQLIEVGMAKEVIPMNAQELWTQCQRVIKLVDKVQGSIAEDIKRLQDINDFENGCG